MALANRVVRAHLHLGGVAVVRHFFEGHVLRDIHHHRARTTAAGNVECLFHGFRQIARVLDQEVVLHDGTGNAHGIAFLKRVQADCMRRHLPGDDHHRDAVHVGRGDAGDGIGHAWAGGDQGHADVACGAGVTVGRMNRRLFVANQHVLNRVLFEERVVNVQDGATGVTPDVLDLFGLQCFNQNLCAAQFVVGGRVGNGRGSHFGFG